MLVNPKMNLEKCFLGNPLLDIFKLFWCWFIKNIAASIWISVLFTLLSTWTLMSLSEQLWVILALLFILKLYDNKLLVSDTDKIHLAAVLIKSVSKFIQRSEKCPDIKIGLYVISVCPPDQNGKFKSQNTKKIITSRQTLKVQSVWTELKNVCTSMDKPVAMAVWREANCLLLYAANKHCIVKILLLFINVQS